MKYIWPPLIQALEERKQKIAEGLAAADKGQHEMELAEKRAVSLMKDAKIQAADIVGLAQNVLVKSLKNRKPTLKLRANG